jgi:hypothetical protein
MVEVYKITGKILPVVLCGHETWSVTLKKEQIDGF